MLERLLPYDLVVEYEPGTKIVVADYSSRAPISEDNHRTGNLGSPTMTLG